jgi:hypothetical protein
MDKQAKPKYEPKETCPKERQIKCKNSSKQECKINKGQLILASKGPACKSGHMALCHCLVCTHFYGGVKPCTSESNDGEVRISVK